MCKPCVGAKVVLRFQALIAHAFLDRSIPFLFHISACTSGSICRKRILFISRCGAIVSHFVRGDIFFDSPCKYNCHPLLWGRHHCSGTNYNNISSALKMGWTSVLLFTTTKCDFFYHVLWQSCPRPFWLIYLIINCLLVDSIIIKIKIVCTFGSIYRLSLYRVYGRDIYLFDAK